MADAPVFPNVGDGSGIERGAGLHVEELQLALRNKALPLEGLRYDVTPVGMHYLLVHYDVPFVDPAEWRLSVGGHVRAPLTLTLEEIQRRPSETIRVTMECAGDGRALLSPRPISQPWLTGAVGNAEWTGTPLRLVLEEAGLGDRAREILFTSLDRGFEGGVEQDYQRSLSIDVAMHCDALLAWAMNGGPLEPQHGFPVRLVVPGWYGMAHVKWLRSIEALTEPFQGYQMATAYRYSSSREEPGEPVTLMRVRSLMIPPGIPDFLTRTRVVRRGRVELQGRAWAGRERVTRVDVSVDGGASWNTAEVGAASGAYDWQPWRFPWEVDAPGEYELCCRAHDSGGRAQPLEPYWTARGMGNNEVHKVRVTVV